MSLSIHVAAYSGYKANERRRQFSLDDEVFEIAGVEDRGYDAKRRVLRGHQVTHPETLEMCNLCLR